MCVGIQTYICIHDCASFQFCKLKLAFFFNAMYFLQKRNSFLAMFYMIYLCFGFLSSAKFKFQVNLIHIVLSVSLIENININCCHEEVILNGT